MNENQDQLLDGLAPQKEEQVEGVNIKQGDSIVMVRDTLLAAAMVAVGVPLRDDPPYTHERLTNGRDVWTFLFRPSSDDGSITAKECIEAWQGDLNWIKAHTQHPFAFAMIAVKNLISFREFQRDHKPFHGYIIPSEGDEPDSILMVKAGSNKEKLAIQKGYQRK